ncbi:putative WRKY transcription factor 17 [Bidens hawaiensis]|uniref:putative WRKY transcription factor 17 n=1 Tax=Bidens hawaiensis TaxID=980011 RepID=UPI00404ADCCD
MAVDFVGIQTAAQHLNRIFHLNNHDFSDSPTFKQAVTVLNRSGHARFRRGPHAPSVSSQSDENMQVESTAASMECSLKKCVTDTTATASFQSMTSSFVGGSVDGSVSNGRQLSSLGIVAPTPSFSSRKPPLPSSHRKRNSADVKHSVSGVACRCCKKRKTGSKREVRRIPIIGSKVESIPADDYSWKKYGEKKVDGSPFPRVYYKCNSVKGCPARKCVELALTDSKMLIVTYAREHTH